jgi:hypothetical protein
VSQFEPGTPPLSGYFPARNRVIAGLSLGVVVVEAAEKSGSLITAGLAGELGREVMAVPGPLTSPLSVGAHRLIGRRRSSGLGGRHQLPLRWRDRVKPMNATTATTASRGRDSLAPVNMPTGMLRMSHVEHENKTHARS